MIEYQQDRLDSVFRALSSPARREIVSLLSGRPYNIGELAPHNHFVNAINGAPGAGNAGHIPAATKYLAQANATVSGNQTGVNLYGSDGPAQTFAASIDNTGGNQPHENMSPYLVLNFIIALQGIFPSRN